MRIVFSRQSWEDYLYWQQHDPEMLRRINDLIRDSSRDPFKGIGKPEPLRNSLRGWWSRRTTREHRLVYRITGTGAEQQLEIAACRFHYER